MRPRDLTITFLAASVAVILLCVGLDAAAQESPGTALAAPVLPPGAPAVPMSPSDIVAGVEGVRSAWHSSALAGLMALVMLLTRILRTPIGGRLLDRIPPEWRWTVPTGLGVAAGVLAGLLAGVPWYQAALDGGMVGLAAIGAHSALIRDLLGMPSPRQPSP